MTAKAAKHHNTLTYKEFADALAGDQDPGQVVFFYGAEPFLIDRAVRMFVDAHLDDKAFNKNLSLKPRFYYDPLQDSMVAGVYLKFDF